MKVLICGGRDFDDRALVGKTLTPRRADITEIIHGAARGADTLADEWAQVWGIPSRAFPALWRRHGRAAGPIRNQRMLDEGKPDLVIAFPGGKGTADMVERARGAGVAVQEISRCP